MEDDEYAIEERLSVIELLLDAYCVVSRLPSLMHNGQHLIHTLRSERQQPIIRYYNTRVRTFSNDISFQAIYEQFLILHSE